VLSPPPPSTAIESGVAFTVAAEDDLGNPDPTFTGSVTVALTGGPAGAALSGPVTVNARQGLATFAGLLLNELGSGYTFAVSSGGLRPTAVGPVTVTAGPAVRFVVTGAPPSRVAVGTRFGFTVTAEDAQGNIATSFNGSVRVVLAADPAHGVLGGARTVAAVNGVAHFGGLTLSKAGGYVLQVSSAGVAPDTVAAVTARPVLQLKAP